MQFTNEDFSSHSGGPLGCATCVFEVYCVGETLVQRR